MSTSFHSFSCHSSQNESGMRKWPKNDDFRPEWDWPHPSHSLSFDSFGGHPKPGMTLEWGKTSFSSHFRGITKPSFPSSEKCFNFGTMGIDGQANDTEWLENDKNDCGMIGMSPKWDEWRKNDVDDCHIIWIDQNWDEWRSNDMNESRMRWMTVEWCEWLLNDRNDYRMIGMSLKWDEWRKNDVDDCQMIWMSQEWDEWLLNDVNDYWTMGMSLKWDRWLLNDRNET